MENHATSRPGRARTAATVAALLVLASLARAQEPTLRIRSGAASNIAYGPNFVLEDRALGIAALHGLDFSVRMFATGPAMLEAALAGELDLAIMNARVALPMVASGKACFKAPVNFIDIPSVQIVGRSEIRSPRDLVGRKVGTVAGAVGNIALHLWLDRHGVPRSQVTVANVAPPDMPVALARGNVDAIIWTEPTPRLAIAMTGPDKAHYIGNIGEAYRDTAPINLTCDWYARAGDRGMERITAAWIEAVEWVKANPEKAAAIAGKRLQMDAGEVLQFWREGGWLAEGWPANLTDAQIDMYRLNAEYLISIGELKEMPDLRPWISAKWLRAVAPQRVDIQRHAGF